MRLTFVPKQMQMEQTKHILASKTVHGALFGALGSLILLFLVHTPEAKYFALVQLISSIWATIGRIRAKTRIRIRRKNGHKD